MLQELRCSFRWRFSVLLMLGAILALGPAIVAQAQSSSDSSITQAPLVFTGGHETDPRDHGQPVVLIAALGVSPDVFRNAFSRVHPAGRAAAVRLMPRRANKQVLMAALGPYGITDDRLNAVSNHYRYRAWANELWPTQPAVGYALVKDGVVTGFVITGGGYGYSLPLAVTVPGGPNAIATAQLSFDLAFEKNGAVSSVTLAPAK